MIEKATITEKGGETSGSFAEMVRPEARPSLDDLEERMKLGSPVERCGAMLEVIELIIKGSEPRLAADIVLPILTGLIKTLKTKVPRREYLSEDEE